MDIILINHLNDIKLPSPKGGLWNDRTVHRILKNPAYIGYIRFCDGGFKRNYDNENIILFKGKHKSIIDEQLFNAVQEDLKLLEKKYKVEIPEHGIVVVGMDKCK